MANNDTDKELDDLLDTALEDFDKKLDLNVPEAASSYTIENTNIIVEEVDDDSPPKSSTNPNLLKNKLDDDEMKLFEEIFSDEGTRESMKQFKDVLNMFGQNPDSIEGKHLLENFEKVMSDLTNVDDDEDDDEDLDKELDFLKKFTKPSTEKPKETLNLYEDDIDDEDRKPSSSLFNKVLDDLNKNTDKVLNSGPSLNSEFFSKLNFAGGDDEDGDDDLMMEPILSMLFSKDVLYPSLKLMLENYEKYLVEKKESLSKEEFDKCNMQKDSIQKMCEIYEKSKDTDSKQEKSEQLKQILDLLEKCGVFYEIYLSMFLKL